MATWLFVQVAVHSGLLQMPPPRKKQLGWGQKLNKVPLMTDTGRNREVKKPFFLKSLQYLLKRRWQMANVEAQKVLPRWMCPHSVPAAGWDTQIPWQGCPHHWKKNQTWNALKRNAMENNQNIPSQPFGVFWLRIVAPGDPGFECSLWGRAAALLLHASRTKALCSDVGAAGINSWWSFSLLICTARVPRWYG